MMRSWIAILALAAAPLAAGAQDSTAILTDLLSTGSVDVRQSAVERLHARGAGNIPEATWSLLIRELESASTTMMDGSPADDALGEYWMSLVVLVAQHPTVEAYRALVPAVGVSPGIARRVAQLGAEAVDPVRSLIGRGHEVSAALRTLGLVWFASDTFALPLDETARGRILGELSTAFESTDFDRVLGLQAALGATGDPSFLPVAQALRDRLAASAEPYAAPIRAMLDRTTIPVLSTAVVGASATLLAGRLTRTVGSICGPAPTPSARLGACNELRNMGATVERLVISDRPSALVVLGSFLDVVAQARLAGIFSALELQLLEGSATQLREKLE